jgi:hypothetical protein
MRYPRLPSWFWRSGTIKSREFSITQTLRPIMFSGDNSALQTAGSPREAESSSNGKQNEYSHGSDGREQCECTWSHTDPEISRSVSDDRDDDTSRVIEKSNVVEAAIRRGWMTRKFSWSNFFQKSSYSMDGEMYRSGIWLLGRNQLMEIAIIVWEKDPIRRSKRSLPIARGVNVFKRPPNIPFFSLPVSKQFSFRSYPHANVLRKITHAMWIMFACQTVDIKRSLLSLSTRRQTMILHKQNILHA